MEEPVSEEMLKQVLIRAFTYLMEEDIPKMMTILYRADVDEEKLKKSLSDRGEVSAAEVVASAYLARQKAKIETWKKYSR